GVPAPIFLVAGLLADQHEPRPRAALSEHRLRRSAVQRTRRAAGGAAPRAAEAALAVVRLVGLSGSPAADRVTPARRQSSPARNRTIFHILAAREITSSHLTVECS